MEGEFLDDEATHGVIPRMVNSIFEGIFNAPAHVEFYVKVYLNTRFSIDNTTKSLLFSLNNFFFSFLTPWCVYANASW